MTTLGPDHFFSCPHCKTVLRRWTYWSGNSFGSELWSDGYLNASMLPLVVPAKTCPSCKNTFFIEDADDLGEHWSNKSHSGDAVGPLPEGYKDAPFADDPDDDAISELIPLTKDRGRLLYLCTHLWHSHNHVNRNEIAKVEPAVGFKRNLERIIGLFDNDRGQEQIMKAEALRELGRHDEALATLQDVDSKFAWVADQIRALAQARRRAVTVLLLISSGVFRSIET